MDDILSRKDISGCARCSVQWLLTYVGCCPEPLYHPSLYTTSHPTPCCLVLQVDALVRRAVDIQNEGHMRLVDPMWTHDMQKERRQQRLHIMTTVSEGLGSHPHRAMPSASYRHKHSHNHIRCLSASGRKYP